MNARMIITVVLIVLLLAGGIALEVTISNVFNELSEKIDALVDYESVTYSLEDVEEIRIWWRKKHAFLETVLPHTQINEIEMSFGELVGAVAAEDYPSATAMLCRIRETSMALAEMFTFRIGNIL